MKVQKRNDNGDEAVEYLNNEDITPSARPFRHDMTVEFNGQTMFSLPSEIQALLTTDEARASAKLYINNVLYLYPGDWTITSGHLQFTRPEFSLATFYEISLLR